MSEEAGGDAQEVCPHCGSVLELARAIEREHSVLRPRAKRRPASAGTSPPDDPSVA